MSLRSFELNFNLKNFPLRLHFLPQERSAFQKKINILKTDSNEIIRILELLRTFSKATTMEAVNPLRIIVEYWDTSKYVHSLSRPEERIQNRVAMIQEPSPSLRQIPINEQSSDDDMDDIYDDD